MKVRFDICNPFYIISIWLFLFIPSKLLIIAMSDGWAGYSQKYSYFYEFILYTFIFIFFLYATYALIINSKYMFIPLNFSFNARNADFYFSSSRTIISCIIILLLFLLYLRLVDLSINDLLNSRLVDFKLAKGSQISFAIFCFYTTLLQIAFFFNILYLYRNKRNYSATFFISLTYLFIAVFSGSRYMFLDMFMIIILARMLVIRSIPWFRLVLCMSFLVIFFGYYGALRATNFGDVDIITVLLREVNIGDLIMQVLDKRTDSYFPNGPIYLENRDLFGLRYGLEIIKVFLMIIPKSILPERETFFAQEWNDKLQLQSEGGTGFTPIVEAMVNFGVIGVVFYGVLGGYLLAIASNWYTRCWLNNNPIGVFFVARIFIQVLNSAIISGGYGSPGIIGFLLNFFCFCLIMTVIKHKYRWN